MGERLVTSVYKSSNDDRPIMSIYQHYSAYSISTYMEIKRIYNSIVGKNSEKDMLLSLSEKGIYPCREEFDELCRKYGFDFDKNRINRDKGVIAVDKIEISLFEKASDRTARIYIDTGQCHNYCFIVYDDKNEWFEEFGYKYPENDVNSIRLKECPWCPDEFNIADIDGICGWVKNVNGPAFTYNGIIYTKIGSI